MITVTSPEKEIIFRKIEDRKEQLKLCNQERDQALALDSAKIYGIADNLYLVEILCFLGAYQGNYQYLLFDDSDMTISKVSFPTFEGDNPNLRLTNTNTLVGMMEFIPESQILTVQAKTRGLGDCGSFAQYQWHKNRFQLLEYRQKFECDGVYVQPEDYPLIYP